MTWRTLGGTMRGAAVAADEMDKEISDGLDTVYGGQQPARVAMAEVTRKVNAILATIK